MFWVVTPCNFLDGHKISDEPVVCSFGFLNCTLMSTSVVTVYKIVWCQNPEVQGPYFLPEILLNNGVCFWSEFEIGSLVAVLGLLLISPLGWYAFRCSNAFHPFKWKEINIFLAENRLIWITRIHCTYGVTQLAIFCKYTTKCWKVCIPFLLKYEC